MRRGHVMTFKAYRLVLIPILGLLFRLSMPAHAQDIPKRAPHPDLLGGNIHAQDLERLLGPDMQNAFTGRKMLGVYKNPRARSGSQFFTETFHADGTTRYKEGSVADKGRWSTQNDRLCFDYSGVMAGQISCFFVYRIGTCYYSYGTGQVFNGKPIIPNAWSVKSKLDGDLSTCEDLMS